MKRQRTAGRQAVIPALVGYPYHSVTEARHQGLRYAKKRGAERLTVWGDGHGDFWFTATQEDYEIATANETRKFWEQGQ